MNRPNELDTWIKAKHPYFAILYALRDHKTQKTIYAFTKVLMINGDTVICDVYTVWKEDATSSIKDIFNEHCKVIEDSSISSGCSCRFATMYSGHMDKLDRTHVHRAFINVYLSTPLIQISHLGTQGTIATLCEFIADACKTCFTALDINQCSFLVHATAEHSYCHALYNDMKYENNIIQYTPTKGLSPHR